jgi:hypothetical protein
MHEHNKIKIRQNNEVTPSVQISKGVGQGCPACQTLFNIYIKNSFRMEHRQYRGIQITIIKTRNPSFLQMIRYKQQNLEPSHEGLYTNRQHNIKLWNNNTSQQN